MTIFLKSMYVYMYIYTRGIPLRVNIFEIMLKIYRSFFNYMVCRDFFYEDRKKIGIMKQIFSQCYINDFSTQHTQVVVFFYKNGFCA